MTLDAYRVATVRGQIDDALAAELLEFWGRTIGLTGPAARARIPEVIAVVRHGDAIAGASSVFPSEVGEITGRIFYVLRTLLPGGAASARPALYSQVFALLDAEYDEAPESVAGLCVLCDAAERRARPEAVWDDPPLAHAGFLADGRQVRIAYFADDMTRSYAPDIDAGGEYRVLDWARQSELRPEHVVAMWAAEGALSPEEARRRIAELLVVAVDPTGLAVGACTGYVKCNDQLGADFWHVRMFVAAAHRRSYLSERLGSAYRTLLAERFTAGDDRAIGIVYEVQNPVLMRHPPRGVWPSGPFLYMTTRSSGSQVRVHYFPGAMAPAP